MNTNKPEQKKYCTLTDKELVERCEWWIDTLCKSHGEAWALRVPVDFNYDPDMVFTELICRYKLAKEGVEGGQKEGYSLEDMRECWQASREHVFYLKDPAQTKYYPNFDEWVKTYNPPKP